MSEQAGAAAGDNPTGGQESAHWADALPADLVFEDKPLRDHPKIREFKSIPDLAKSYVGQLGLLGKKTLGLAPLPADATDEQRKAWDTEYRKTVGVPEAPEKYAYTKEVPEGYNLDNPAMGEFKATAHSLGLTPGQFDGLVDHIFSLDAKGREAAAAAAKKAAEEGETTLKAEWGDKFDANKLANERVLSMFGEDAFITKVKEMGLGSSPEFNRFLAKLAPHFSEDSMRGDGDGALTKGAKTRAELFSLRADEKYGKDPAFTTSVDAEYERAFPGDYPLAGTQGR